MGLIPVKVRFATDVLTEGTLVDEMLRAKLELGGNNQQNQQKDFKAAPSLTHG